MNKGSAKARKKFVFNASAHLMHDDGLGEKENLGSYRDVLVPKDVSLHDVDHYIECAMLEAMYDADNEGRTLRVTFRFRVPKLVNEGS